MRQHTYEWKSKFNGLQRLLVRLLRIAVRKLHAVVALELAVIIVMHYSLSSSKGKQRSVLHLVHQFSTKYRSLRFHLELAERDSAKQAVETD
jgi:hypothetical protein